MNGGYVDVSFEKKFYRDCKTARARARLKKK